MTTSKHSNSIIAKTYPNFYFFIHPPDLQESGEGAIHKTLTYLQR